MRKYNIPLKDIKEVKQEIVECSSGSGNNDGGSSEDNKDININQTYISNRVCWKVNKPISDEAIDALGIVTLVPIYSSIVYDGGDILKTYGHDATLRFLYKLKSNDSKNYVIAFEETKINKFGDVTVNENDVLLSLLQTVGITESNLNELGIYKIPHEEYLTLHDKVMNPLEFK